jgi:branched-chain amino acid transport system ATP-binding protein
VSHLLDARGLTAGYGPLRVLLGMDFHVDEGEVVVILGANGAGKTTTLRALSGMIAAKGEVTFDGVAILGRKPEEIVRLGIAHVPQGRGTIADLTVEENLRVGAITRRDGEVVADMEHW